MRTTTICPVGQARAGLGSSNHARVKKEIVFTSFLFNYFFLTVGARVIDLILEPFSKLFLYLALNSIVSPSSPSSSTKQEPIRTLEKSSKPSYLHSIVKIFDLSLVDSSLQSDECMSYGGCYANLGEQLATTISTTVMPKLLSRQWYLRHNALIPNLIVF